MLPFLKNYSIDIVFETWIFQVVLKIETQINSNSKTVKNTYISANALYRNARTSMEEKVYS